MMRNSIFDLEKGGVDLYMRSTYIRVNTVDAEKETIQVQLARA